MRWAHQHSRPGTEGCVSAVCFAAVLTLLCELRKYRHTGDVHDHPLMTAVLFLFFFNYFFGCSGF